MARFMMVYKGDATDVSVMTQEQSDAVMAAWGAWMEKVGPALTDVGTPFGAGSSIVDDGSSGRALSLTGYSIVDADDMDAAQALAEGHPYLSEGKGAFAVDLFELMPVPFED
jgi:hypothetical protein